LDLKPLSSADALAKILDLAEDAIISVDGEQRIVLFNHGAERMFGYTAQEVDGQPLDILLPKALARPHRDQIRAFAKVPAAARRMSERSRIHGRRKDGTEFPAEASISKVDMNGSMTFTAILRDVTERVAAEEKIMTTLREKEVLLKEIHHRVKNNLQVVASLLGLQARASAGDEMRRMLLESQNRVYTMALLHESLYHSPNLSQIDFPDYIHQLVSHLFRSYGVETGRIHLETKLDRLYLDLDTAVGCGLIINELVSNSLKYAFPNEASGIIRIELQSSDHVACLVVADNGIGVGNHIDLATAKTLGLRLVRTLVEQLGGSIELRSNGGSEARLSFPVAN
jgi:PAS domain S-box-containing protein